jgi:hypothetical protein
VFAAGHVYFQSEEGVTHVVAAGKSFELVSTNDVEERTLASMAVDNGALFLRTETHLLRIGQ